jgi:hypothetical protein
LKQIAHEGKQQPEGLSSVASSLSNGIEWNLIKSVTLYKFMAKGVLDLEYNCFSTWKRQADPDSRSADETL